MAKRMLLLAAIFVALFSLGSVVVSADNHEESVDNGAWEYTGDAALIKQYTDATKRCDSPSLECLVYYVVNYTAIELTNSIAPIDGVEDPNEGGDPTTQSDFSGPEIAGRKGVVPGLAYLIGQMYGNPPATTETYVADVLNSAGVAVAQPAYAQGLGFVALNPILNLWKTFRNIAYIFYVLLFVIIGFMIMFRQKVGQQAITAQQAIPSIIVSLIFVTFSYAIAGFLIDVMYLSMFLIIGVFETVAGFGTEVISYNIFDLGAEFIGQGYSSSSDASYRIVPTMIEEALGQGLGILDGPIGWVSGITVGLVVAIAVLISTFKLFFELLKSYATIILMVVTAPIQLMVGAIPGKNTMGSWVKSLIGNLAAFPVVLISFIMFKIFVSGAIDTNAGGFMPPFLIDGGTADAIVGIMGLAILLAIPEIVKKIKDMLGVSGGFGEMIAKAGWDSAKAGWKGDKYSLGIGARHIVKPGATIAATGATTGAGGLIGGAVGGLIGAGQSIRSGGGLARIRSGIVSGANKGASVGFRAPTYAAIAPRLAKSTYETARKETSQYMQYAALEGIYQRIIDSPWSPEQAKKHAVEMLEQIEKSKKSKRRGAP